MKKNLSKNVDFSLGSSNLSITISTYTHFYCTIFLILENCVCGDVFAMNVNDAAHCSKKKWKNIVQLNKCVHGYSWTQLPQIWVKLIYFWKHFSLLSAGLFKWEVPFDKKKCCFLGRTFFPNITALCMTSTSIQFQ